MITLTVTPQDQVLSDLLSSLDFTGKDKTIGIYKAITTVGNMIQKNWYLCAMGSTPPDSTNLKLKKANPDYARSIKVRRMSPFWVQVYSNYKSNPRERPQSAESIEEGTKAYNLRDILPHSKKTRVVKKTVLNKYGIALRKKGDPYLRIPFRHLNMENSTNESTVALLQKIRQAIREGEAEYSRVTVSADKSTHVEPNVKGELIPRAQYKWGTRFKGTGLSRLEGMLVFNVSTPGAPRSEYFTFRTLSVNSPAFKWFIAAQVGMHFTKHILLGLQQEIVKIIEMGVREELGI